MSRLLDCLASLDTLYNQRKSSIYAQDANGLESDIAWFLEELKIFDS